MAARPQRCAMAVIEYDGTAFAGSQVYAARVEALLAAMLDDEGTRVPGARRDTAQAQAAAHGIEVPDALWRELQALAGEEVGAPH